MIELILYTLLCVSPIINNYKTYAAEPSAYQLTLHVQDEDLKSEASFTDVVVKRVGDRLTMSCELSPGSMARPFVWNTPASINDSLQRPYTVEPSGPTLSSKLVLPELQVADSGHYMCMAPPYSQTKYILVQPPGPKQCAKNAFWCGEYCVLAMYVCDGHRDCARGEDEAPAVCDTQPCAMAHKLNCSSGRCISAAACCRACAAQPDCCREHPRYSLQTSRDLDFPPLFEDRHAPDDYGFIQSTIYTVTACALIFMIAVVLLVSAICKMHMKRAALRSYAHAERATANHYNMHYAQSARFPPCYEAARLLDAPPEPDRQSASSPSSPERSGFGLARLGGMLSGRYTQVPTSCVSVELRAVSGPVLADYLRPATSPAPAPTAAAPRPLTLQLGRFQLSLPRLRRERRPDTPTIEEINIDDIDFVRNDTYTLNGRTIRLLGANFENYPENRPPPYTDAMRYKLYGPPPEYLSREGLNGTEEEARSNVEMPPGYEEASGSGRVIAMGGEVAMDYVMGDVATGSGNVTANNIVTGDVVMGNGNVAMDNTVMGDVAMGNGNVAMNNFVMGDVTMGDGNVAMNNIVVGDVALGNGDVVINKIVMGNVLSDVAAGSGNVAIGRGDVATGSGNVVMGSGVAINNNVATRGDVAMIINIATSNINVTDNTTHPASPINTENVSKDLIATDNVMENVATNFTNDFATNDVLTAATNNSTNNETNNVKNNGNITPDVIVRTVTTALINENTPVHNTNNNETNNVSINDVIDNLPAIDSDVNANEAC